METVVVIVGGRMECIMYSNRSSALPFFSRDSCVHCPVRYTTLSSDNGPAVSPVPATPFCSWLLSDCERHLQMLLIKIQLGRETFAITLCYYYRRRHHQPPHRPFLSFSHHNIIPCLFCIAGWIHSAIASAWWLPRTFQRNTKNKIVLLVKWPPFLLFSSSFIFFILPVPECWYCFLILPVIIVMCLWRCPRLLHPSLITCHSSCPEEHEEYSEREEICRGNSIHVEIFNLRPELTKQQEWVLAESA